MLAHRAEYWRYHDGWVHVPNALRKVYENSQRFDPDIKGWHCHFYTKENYEFEDWIKENIKGRSDCTLRFNDGDPMYTVYIAEDEDAVLFKLKWL